MVRIGQALGDDSTSAATLASPPTVATPKAKRAAAKGKAKATALPQEPDSSSYSCFWPGV